MLELEGNGVRHALDVDPTVPLLQVLRDELTITPERLRRAAAEPELVAAYA